MLRCENAAGGKSHIHLQLMIPYLLPYQLLISFPYLFENKASVYSLAKPKCTSVSLSRQALCCWRMQWCMDVPLK